MAVITLKGFKCERCGHIWIPRDYENKTNYIPISCGKCKSPYWNTKRKIEKVKQEVKKKVG